MVTRIGQSNLVTNKNPVKIWNLRPKNNQAIAVLFIAMLLLFVLLLCFGIKYKITYKIRHWIQIFSKYLSPKIPTAKTILYLSKSTPQEYI